MRARTIRAASYRATFWEKQTLETQNPPMMRAGVPAKPGNIENWRPIRVCS